MENDYDFKVKRVWESAPAKFGVFYRKHGTDGHYKFEHNYFQNFSRRRKRRKKLVKKLSKKVDIVI